MNHLMLDIETMSTDNNALVVSISAVQFDMTTGEIGAEFEIGLDQKQQLEKGAEMDIETVNWWSKQDKEAIEALSRIVPRDVDEALKQFNDFIKLNFKPISKIKLWGNGATFDNVIVRNLYKRHSIDFVIPYYADMDVRTLCYLKKINPRSFEFKGIKHNGIDDCKHQINYCTQGI